MFPQGKQEINSSIVSGRLTGCDGIVDRAPPECRNGLRKVAQHHGQFRGNQERIVMRRNLAVLGLYDRACQ